MINKTRTSNPMRKRKLFILLGIISVIYIGLMLRLFYLMILNGKYYKNIAMSQWTDKITLQPKRGRILDRNGHELALSADVYRIDLDMNVIKTTLIDKDKDIDVEMNKLAQELSSTLKMNVSEVAKILDSKRPNGLPASFVNLKRRVEKSEADAVRSMGLRGIMISSDTRRYYSNNNFLSHVIGGINAEGNGFSGVELKYNEILLGIPGVKVVETDIKNNQLPYSTAKVTEAVPGKDLLLTIDEKIQHIAEDVAKSTLEKNKANSVSITVMNPNNGEILAMVNKPDFDPNSPIKADSSIEKLQELWKNRAVENVFEPGSVFKILTTAAAIEKGVVSESDRFVCNGSLRVAGTTVRCWKRDGHGTQNVVDILKNSCNIGFMELGKRLGKENLVAFAIKMGLGQITGVDLPGESTGIVKNVNNITELDLATMSFGQSIAVTQIQFLTAFNAVANGGYLIKPHIVKDTATEASSGNTADNADTIKKKKVLDEAIASTLRGYLEKVVSEGGSREAFIEGYRIGGKTGTAQRVDIDSGQYENEKYVSSFVGMAPSDSPVISVMITIDQPDPSNYYGGQTAAPAAKELFNRLISYISLKSASD